jgi:tetratricopeptide (TPR) repeat protein
LRSALSFWLYTPPYLSLYGRFRDILFAVYDPGFYIGLLLIAGLTCLIVILSPLVYRRIIREETGLVARNKAVPLEESSLSHKRLKRSFFRYGWMLTVLYLLTAVGFAIDVYLKGLQGRPVWMAGCGLESWEMFFRYHGTLFGIVGLLFLVAFRQSHRHFLHIAQDEVVFSRFPPLVTRDTPFRQRLFLEWIVFFGIFLAAGLIAVISVSFFVGNTISWSPRSPFLLFTMLLLMFGGSLGVSAVTVRFPAFRWITNISGLVLLVAAMIYLHNATLQLKWQTYPFAVFFDSMTSWPVVFAVMILDILLLIAAVMTLLVGGLYLRAKWSGVNSCFERFPSRRTVVLISSAICIAVVVLSLCFQSNMKREYFALHLVCRSRTEWNQLHHERMITLATDCLKIFSNNDKRPLTAYTPYGIRAKMYLREGKYDEAINDYDEIISFADSVGKGRMVSIYFHERGQAKCGQGDLDGAIEDFKMSMESTPHECGDQWYHLGYAYEKQGDIESAIDAYSKAIQRQEQFQDPIPIRTYLPRPGYDDAAHLTRHPRYGDVGYQITLDGLKTIRDNLPEQQ